MRFCVSLIIPTLPFHIGEKRDSISISFYFSSANVSGGLILSLHSVGSSSFFDRSVNFYFKFQMFADPYHAYLIEALTISQFNYLSRYVSCYGNLHTFLDIYGSI